MKKILLTTFSLMAISSIASANPLSVEIWGANDIENGVYCSIKDVSMLAKSEADCAKAGGKVTHKHKDAAGKK